MADGPAARQTFPFRGILRQLSPGESILYLGQLASAAKLLACHFKLALLSAHALAMLASPAHGWHVGAHLLPLLVVKAIQVPNLLTMGTGGTRAQAFGIRSQVDVFPAQLLEEQLRAIASTFLSTLRSFRV